ncbi:uncharacterized protein AKAW2_60613A [Aspergillus luchuensis]|uniref:Uncharacterized protein n=1 Tax=Aspergillus kawachii TaxID=1069201 RepID=A0A7R8A163_ASPKA|nr:uncharacterized protein AKAW2_60613A [Aspergillus luchuensis]BCS02349.1 hypothetical protein AKAW2_60613A [Aspergillus luchuensis]
MSRLLQIIGMNIAIRIVSKPRAHGMIYHYAYPCATVAGFYFPPFFFFFFSPSLVSFFFFAELSFACMAATEWCRCGATVVFFRMDGWMDDGWMDGYCRLPTE